MGVSRAAEHDHAAVALRLDASGARATTSKARTALRRFSAGASVAAPPLSCNLAGGPYPTQVPIAWNKIKGSRIAVPDTLLAFVHTWNRGSVVWLMWCSKIGEHFRECRTAATLKASLNMPHCRQQLPVTIC